MTEDLLGDDIPLGAVRTREEDEDDPSDEVVSIEESVSSLIFLRASCLTYIGLGIERLVSARKQQSSRNEPLAPCSTAF